MVDRGRRTPVAGGWMLSKRWTLAVGLVLAAASAALLAAFGVMFETDADVAAGPRAVAEVAAVLHRPQLPKGGDTTVLRIRFTPHGGQSVETAIRTTRSRIQPGESIAITYLPDRPTTARAVRGAENAWRVPLIGGGFLAVFAAMFLWGTQRSKNPGDRSGVPRS